MAKVAAASLDFFATLADMKLVLDFLFTSTDVRMFELYSQDGEKLREFHTFEEFAEYCPMTTTRPGNPQTHFVLWSRSVLGSRVTKRKIEGRDHKTKKPFVRYKVETRPGITVFNVGGVNHETRRLIPSHFGHVSEARLARVGSGKAVDWQALKVVSNKIVYHIRKRVAAATAQARPFLPGALELVRQGYELPGFLPAEVKRLRALPADSNS